jgi:hypothetical protein
MEAPTMALSSKDRLIKIIEALPDDAPFDDMIHDLAKRHGMGTSRVLISMLLEGLTPVWTL